MDQLAHITSTNLNDLISQRLRQYIIQNHLKAGDKLPTEDQFAKQMGVSRTAVREALRSLEALGLVDARQGYGRVVCDFSFEALLNNLSFGVAYSNESIVNLFEIRKALDFFFIDRALPNITPDDIVEMKKLVAEMARHQALGEPISEEDHLFHQLIYKRAGNPLALQLFEITWVVRLYALDQEKALKEEAPGTVTNHQAILTAIEMNDVELSRRLLFDHHWNMEQRFKAWFQ
jgi:DNA-binding FadR family transcriptional regulator